MSLAVMSPAPAGHERRLDLGRVGVHPAHDALEVQDDVGDVLLDPLDGRELVGDALDPDGRDGRARERGEQHAAERVAVGVAEATLEGLDDDRFAVLAEALDLHVRCLEVEHRGRFLTVVFVSPGRRPRAGGEDGVSGLLGVELDDELLLHRRGDLPPLRLAQHLRGEAVVIGLQPRGDLTGELGGVGDQVLGVECP